MSPWEISLGFTVHDDPHRPPTTTIRVLVTDPEDAQHIYYAADGSVSNEYSRPLLIEAPRPLTPELDLSHGAPETQLHVDQPPPP